MNEYILQAHKWNRYNKAKQGLKYFCQIYLKKYFYTEFSLMHEELFTTIDEVIHNGKADNIVRAAPRGGAKSTIISLALPLYCALYNLKHYILIISDTASQADSFLTNIKDELEENELIINDFGNQVGDPWTNSDIVLKNGIKIQSLGEGKKIRGRKHNEFRPDLIIVDDLENDENIMSADQRNKTANWYTKALSKAGDERTDKIVIGTILHYDSLLSKLLKNPTYDSKKYQAVINWSKSNLWDKWEKIITDLEIPNRMQQAEEFYLANKDEMLAGTQVLWPAKEDYYNLMVQRVADGPAAFSSEKQNEPLSDDERRFHPEWIKYFEEDEILGKSLYIAGAVDPSMGKMGGDWSAIITLGMDSNDIVYVLDADIEKRHPDIIISDVLFKQGIYDYKVFGVEQNQFQEYFKDTLDHRLKEDGIDLNVVGIKSHSDKILRIQSLQPHVKSGRLRFRRSQQRLIEQLVNFPSADHDDGPDALELALGMLGRKSAIGEYYKKLSHETNRTVEQSFLKNTGLQGFIR